MPERDPETGHSSRLLRGLIWAGVLLAPLAAAVVLLGQSSASVRFAVLLIAVSVVLIGASVLIRNDPVLHRMHVEDRVAEEIETLRRDLRAEFGRGAPSGSSGFFGDAQMAPPAGDPFPAQPRRTPDPGFAGGGRADPGFASGGRAAVRAPAAAAVAAVRPVGPDPGFGPGRGSEFDEPSFGGRREPGMTSGPRPVAASASIPAPRGAASVPASPAAPRASASVRPGGGQYGRADSADADFGDSNGYAAARVAGTYGSARVAGPASDDYGYAQPDGVYGAPIRPPAPNSYDASNDNGAANGYDSSNGYGQADGYVAANDYGPANGYGAANDYGPADGYRDEGYDDFSPVDADVAGYGLDGDYDGTVPAGDPNYKARRHRPSANDTNVGTLADFAAYPGWSDEPQPDERYVQGYGPRRR